MASQLFNRYIWIIDTIRRYGRITRPELNRLWKRSTVGDGRELARRTFYNYRTAIEELFGISIQCDQATYEYYIAGGDDHSKSVTDWMLNTAAVGTLAGEAAEIAGKIFVEDVPSARQFLATVISALKDNKPVKFDYHPYSRINARRDVVVEPYFLKIFRQRWYLTGRNVKDSLIKTYALDRMSDVTVLRDTFELPDDFDPAAYCNDAFGIVFTQGDVKTIAIKTDTQQAKYFRALPLHHSQEEVLHDNYSIFRYRMKLTRDLVEALLSYGHHVTVIAPPELKAMMTSELSAMLRNYSEDEATENNADRSDQSPV